MSEFILDEFTRTLQRKFGYELGEVETAVETLMPELVIVEPVTFRSRYAATQMTMRFLARRWQGMLTAS